MGKASNRKKHSTGFTNSHRYNGLTVYRAAGVDPKYFRIVVKAIQSIYQYDLAGAKSHVEALERHGVSLFDFEMGLDAIAFGIPQCACAWAFATDARETLCWLTQKAFDEGFSGGMPFFQKLIHAIDSLPADSVDLPRTEFAFSALVACSVSGRSLDALNTVPNDIGPRARAIVINEANKDLARVAQLELNACIPNQMPIEADELSAGEMATVTGPRRL